MSLLLVDIGNTRIKWAPFDGQRMGVPQAATYSAWEVEDFERQLLRTPEGLTGMLVASVAAPEHIQALTEASRRAGLRAPTLVTTTKQAGGITVGYVDPWRLGVDGFVAAIGAHHIFPDKALCVIGVGTAMTVDLIDTRGRHRGGAIIPAPGLMVDTLMHRTSGIRRRAKGGAPGRTVGLFGRSTRAGIVQGSRYAAAATIERAIEEASKRLKEVPLAVLTGGGAQDVRRLVRRPARFVTDLVLRGLAVLAKQHAR
jgi:type III pantothenate kinase